MSRGTKETINPVLSTYTSSLWLRKVEDAVSDWRRIGGEDRSETRSVWRVGSCSQNMGAAASRCIRVQQLCGQWSMVNGQWCPHPPPPPLPLPPPPPPAAPLPIALDPVAAPPPPPVGHSREKWPASPQL